VVRDGAQEGGGSGHPSMMPASSARRLTW
jgi:hypothetical protein